MAKNERIGSNTEAEDFYQGIDDFKRQALSAAYETRHYMDHLGVMEVTASRGEAAQIVDLGDGRFLASVNEELGTKNLIADAVWGRTGISHDFNIGLDTAAAQFNDIISVGAYPISSQAHFAAGSRDFFRNPVRSEALINGYKEGCRRAGASWMGGETGLLEGNVVPGRVVLSGSANGLILGKEKLVLGEKLKAGDKIISLPSTGIHTNGASLARELEDKLADVYNIPLAYNRTFGEVLLAPTPIYLDALIALNQAEIDIHYMVNVTGHGWRKIMRANRDLTYVLPFTQQPQEVFRFIQQHSGRSNEEMYGSFNMGLGFLIFVAGADLKKSLEALQAAGYKKAQLEGHVEEGKKRVIIESLDLVFEDETLQIR